MKQNTRNRMPTAQEFAIEAHSSTNHQYDTLLPYEFHLRLVVKTAKDFIELAEKVCRFYNAKGIALNVEDIIDGCWLHDTIEDARVNYNGILSLYNVDIKAENLNRRVPEIVRAVTNITRGRDRAERMPTEVYNDIVSTPGATFVKMCDRIANAQYSKMMGSGMLKRYRLENTEFLAKLQGPELELLQPMIDKLLKILGPDD